MPRSEQTKTPRPTPAQGTLIAEESSVAGRLRGVDLLLLGRFEGDLEFTGRVRIGAAAEVNARLRAAAVELDGAFAGEIRAERLEFGSGARARGTFLAPVLTIREGAQVEGDFNLDSAEAAEVLVSATGPADGPLDAAAVPAPADDSLRANQAA